MYIKTPIDKIIYGAFNLFLGGKNTPADKYPSSLLIKNITIHSMVC